MKESVVSSAKDFAPPRAVVLGALLAISTAATVYAGSPEDVGLSTERLLRIDAVMERAIEDEQISGAVTLVSRRGEIAHFEAHGVKDLESGEPMRKDTIFAIASMTKPVTGVAVLMLVEEGAVRLSDPVSRFIPEFRDTQVAIPMPKQRGEEDRIYTVPAEREVTVRDLLTHTAGVVTGGASAREVSRVAPRSSRSTHTLATYAAALGAVPLDFQPGTQWAYAGLEGIDVLGRIVEVASGQTFDVYLRERIFEPLGMEDTAFVVSTDRASRVATMYGRTAKGLERSPRPEWLATSTLFSGGGGLWSTAYDYARFAQMLMNGGELGTRLLGSRTVRLMASNHVGDLYASAKTVRAPGGRPGRGFGLIVEVVLDAIEARDGRSTGSFGWSGAFGTTFWVDPKEELLAVLMVQTPGQAPLQADFQNAAMQAIVD